jgi:NAD+ synthase
LSEKDHNIFYNTIISRLIEGLSPYRSLTAVVGMSGGKDSTITIALLLKAGFHVKAITFCTNQGSAKNAEEQYYYAMDVENHFRGENFEHEYRFITLESDFHWPLSYEDIDAHCEYKLPMRRATLLYEEAQRINRSGTPAAVFGTTNYTEAYLGYCGKVSDLACDYQPIISLPVTILRNVGLALGVPHELVYRKPTGDTMDRLTSEERLGFTMDEVDMAMTGKGDPDKLLKMANHRRLNAHKFADNGELMGCFRSIRIKI